jgi:hypothetical protein
MRVILKPAGLLTLLGMLCVLVAIIIGFQISSKNKPEAVLASNITLPTEGSGARRKSLTATAPNPELLNRSMESPFAEIEQSDAPEWKQGAKRSGVVAAGWRDDSRWTDAIVAYAEDKDKPHSGKTSQRIEVKSFSYGRVHFGQRVKLTKNRSYKASIWLRASEETKVEFGLRQSTKPYNYYRYSVVSIGPEWKEVSVLSLISGAEEATITVSLYKPGVNVWVDDAQLKLSE